MTVAALHRSVLAPLLGALMGFAWLALVLGTRSPYGRFAHHGSAAGVIDERMTAVLLVGMWTVMIVAMMLPTSLPLLVLFHRMTRHRRDHLLHAAVERAAWLRAHTWLLGAGILALAGLYQFSRWKRACLDVCRTPQSFLATHWLGRREPAQAFRLGARHGIFCVGCCWSLMLLMFVVGAGSVGWMLALGVVMAIEKNVSWGRRLSAPVGVALLCWGAAISLRALLVS